MARMDWTRTFVEASGLRPTASEAFIPIKPTPMAAPSAARPTVKFPDIYLFVPFLTVRAVEHGRAAELCYSNLRGRRPFFTLANQQGEHGGQQHKHHGLDQPHQ